VKNVLLVIKSTAWNNGSLQATHEMYIS